jgi:hypothetical protein
MTTWRDAAPIDQDELVTRQIDLYGRDRDDDLIIRGGSRGLPAPF